MQPKICFKECLPASVDYKGIFDQNNIRLPDVKELSTFVSFTCSVNWGI
jgi:hypothetical protein